MVVRLATVATGFRVGQSLIDGVRTVGQIGNQELSAGQANWEHEAWGLAEPAHAAKDRLMPSSIQIQLRGGDRLPAEKD